MRFMWLCQALAKIAPVLCGMGTHHSLMHCGKLKAACVLSEVQGRPFATAYCCAMKGALL